MVRLCVVCSCLRRCLDLPGQLRDSIEGLIADGFSLCRSLPREIDN